MGKKVTVPPWLLHLPYCLPYLHVSELFKMRVQLVSLLSFAAKVLCRWRGWRETSWNKIWLNGSRVFFLRSSGVRHDPQRFMGKKVTVPHFNRDTVEFASRKRNESNPGIKTLLPFPKNITEESDFENFQDLIVALDACYWLHKAISRRFGDDRAI